MQARQQVPTTRNLSGICSLEPRVPPRVRPGESKHEYIEASSCGRLALGAWAVMACCIRSYPVLTTVVCTVLQYGGAVTDRACRGNLLTEGPFGVWTQTSCMLILAACLRCSGRPERPCSSQVKTTLFSVHPFCSSVLRTPPRPRVNRVRTTPPPLALQSGFSKATKQRRCDAATPVREYVRSVISHLCVVCIRVECRMSIEYCVICRSQICRLKSGHVRWSLNA